MSCIERGRDRYSMSLGIVSRIRGNDYEIFAVSSSTNVFVPGEIFHLKDTLCRIVVEERRTVARVALGVKLGIKSHPLYDVVPLDSYISSPIFNQSSVVGTLNFTCFKKRQEPFSDEDIAFNEGLAAELGGLFG